MQNIGTSANRVVAEDLDVTYKVEEIEYADGEGATSSWFRVTRTATKSYSYVNLSKFGAKLTAAAMVALYTRPYYMLAKREEDATAPESVGVTQLTTDIETVHASGNAWRVDVSVNEKDVRASATRPEDPASLFSEENSRNYDEGDTNLSISCEAGGEKFVVTFTTNIPQRDWVNAVLQYKTSSTATAWSKDSGATRVGNRINTSIFSSYHGYALRLVIGPYESNIVITP